MSEEREKSEYDLRVDRLVRRAKHLHWRIKRIREVEDSQDAAPVKAVFWGLEILVEGVIVRAVDRLFGNFERKRIHRPPASTVNSVARFFYSKKTYERIFMQLVVDVREEHAEALQARRRWHARWITARGNITMVMTMATHAFTSCGKAVVKIWKLTL